MKEKSDARGVDFKQFDMVVDSPDSPCVQIYQNFVEGVIPILGKIRDAAQSGDRELANDLSHQLNGSSSSFGFLLFAQEMQAAETAAKSGSDIHILDEKWFERITKMFERSVSAVKLERGY